MPVAAVLTGLLLAAGPAALAAAALARPARVPARLLLRPLLGGGDALVDDSPGRRPYPGGRRGGRLGPARGRVGCRMVAGVAGAGAPPGRHRPGRRLPAQ